MTLEDAFKKMIQAYFDEDEDDEIGTRPTVLTKDRLKQTEDEVMERKGAKNASDKQS